MSERIQFTFRTYHRPFRQPLQTHHGCWSIREGIIVQLRDEMGQTGYGEIAPVPWFGSETLEAALAFCQSYPPTLAPRTIAAIPDRLPACQFGVETAWEQLTHRWQNRSQQRLQQQLPLPVCGLLPTGQAALQHWEPLWQAGYRTFKWKIGMVDPAIEQHWLTQLLAALPPDVTLRLDANGGLDWDSAQTWLDFCDRQANRIEFLEQPLPPSQLSAMRHLGQRHTTPLALDESVATIAQLEACLQEGWRGIVVVKPSIAGSPQRFRQLCQNDSVDWVASSVFETAIGQTAALQLAAELMTQPRAVGFGVNHWFTEEDPLSQFSLTFSAQWHHLCPSSSTAPQFPG